MIMSDSCESELTCTLFKLIIILEYKINLKYFSLYCNTLIFAPLSVLLLTGLNVTVVHSYI